MKAKIAFDTAKKTRDIAAARAAIEYAVAEGDFDTAYWAGVIVAEQICDARKYDFMDTHGYALDRVAETALAKGVEIPKWFGAL